MSELNNIVGRFKVIIPTYNASNWVRAQIEGLNLAGVMPDQILVVDSSSTDNTRDLYSAWGAEVVQIAQSDFNHGGTRQWAAERCPEAEFLVYLTQDAIPANTDSIRNLLISFRTSSVAVAYGRQLPRLAAGAIEAHARLFNYPDAAITVCLADKARFGSKVTFCSDSFAAYRRCALMAVGGFPRDVFFAEDQIVAARLLQAGHAKAYVANAKVYHSHCYTLTEEFRRYFDVGVFHARNAWLTDAFGRAEGEGARFVRSELGFLGQNAPARLPESLLRTLCKYSGYRVGRLEHYFTPAFKRLLSASPHYWKR